MMISLCFNSIELCFEHVLFIDQNDLLNVFEEESNKHIGGLSDLKSELLYQPSIAKYCED